ncbi:hypothetical protein LTR56_024396 [Elasticomyces elasticus]|nr:hypothetical protein LTR56_024396 [Elasticomyces elasticus]KAK3622768.1 hypothetical protein LTR22_024661 [Elasticomyces elasticus]KAK4906836.1 hypothetical protein LTR49_024078 [Elasticomyces elasticus]
MNRRTGKLILRTKGKIQEPRFFPPHFGAILAVVFHCGTVNRVYGERWRLNNLSSYFGGSDWEYDKAPDEYCLPFSPKNSLISVVAGTMRTIVGHDAGATGSPPGKLHNYVNKVEGIKSRAYQPVRTMQDCAPTCSHVIGRVRTVPPALLIERPQEDEGAGG